MADKLMRAALVIEEAGSKRIEIQDIARPTPGPGEVLVRVRAAGLNRADLAMNVGHFRSAGVELGAPVPGVEFAGEVVEVGPEVKGVAVGDRVMAMGQGAFAEYTKIHHRLVIRVPASLDFTRAATAPVALMTAHDALITRAGLRPGESVLIQAATSGVGILAAQIARRRGARVVLGTSGSPDKLERLMAMGVGPDVGICTASESTVDKVMAATGGKGADVIIDMVGASCLNDNLSAAALKGRIVGVGRMGGRHAQFDLDFVALRRITMIGVTFRTRTLDEVADVASAMSSDLLAEVDSGAIHWPIDCSFPLEQTAEAYATMRSNSHAGKIALLMG